ncbi:MAG: hypothetical protein MAG431_00562 [Chloroflexi bacterium]|nr:hypothetical protein [Chloroflexota bacterium]
MSLKLKKLLVIPLLLITIFSFVQPAQAEEPVVYAVFFYSPTCPHCEEVIATVLPPLVEKHGLQLQIFAIDTSTRPGNELYQAAVKEFNIPDDRLGVPTMLIGEHILVGGTEIPQQLPSIIEEGLAQGGIDWTYFPGLEEALNAPPEETSTESAEETGWQEKFQQDLAGNILSVIVLAGMIAVLIILGVNFEKYPVSSRSIQYQWLIPVLAVIGLGVAGYLTFIETTQTEAVCGPVGDCNSVQQSPYSTLFGFLPIGVLGAIGYVMILLAWVFHKYGPQNWNSQTITALWGFTLFGTFFSIYLTFLEPFVIGASCIWCLSSAVIITVQLWLSTDLAKAAWKKK